ncbi:MAG TPA: ABC transporter substrate-binding protein [Acidimicrobiales bacterium]|nr:ABC transporter substrate-binding protein [Acidimicrobiales bacterium]
MQPRLRTTAALVAAALILVACGSGDDSADDLGPEPGRAQSQDLRVAVGNDPFLPGDPPNHNLGLVTAGPNPGIFETLTRLTGSFGLQPGLALRWENPTPEQWRFHIRPNVTFHNGARLDAAAVAGTLETIARRQNRPRGLDPGTARANGDVVEITLTAPNTRLAEQLANPSMGIQAPGTTAGGGGEEADTPTGTGPFRFESYAPGSNLVVKAYEGYWGNKPQLTTITFRFGPERDAGRLLATRQVELVGHVPYEFLPKVSGRTDSVKGSPPARAEYLLLNTGGVGDYATLKDDNLRRAIALALDRDAVRKAAWPDDGDTNSSLIPGLVLGEAASSVRAPNQNLNESRRLLEQSGWGPGPDGVRVKQGQALNLSLVLARPDEQAKAADAVRAQLAQVGIGVNVVDPAPESPFIRINASTFDLYLASQVQDDANPCSLCRFFSIKPGGSLAFASSVGGGPKADEIYDRSYTAPSQDSARRVAAELMNVVVAERFTAVPLASLRNEWLISPRVRGFEPAALGGDQRWESVWLTV